MDKGNPPLRSENTATVAIVVSRNQGKPEFINPSSYVATINENVEGGSEVLRVNVQDPDEVVSEWKRSG